MSRLPLSVVIPMYNEDENVEPFIREVYAHVKDFHDVEILVVDDGSKDTTHEKLSKLKSEIPLLRIIRHKKNAGQSAGIISGVFHAKNPWVVTLDGDGQNDPADIIKLCDVALNEMHNSSSILVAGNRGKRNDDWIKRMSSKIANGVRGSLLKDECPDTGCGLKLFPKEVFLRLPHFDHLHRFMPALVKRAGGKIINVSVNHRPRTRGKSKYGVMNRLWVGIVDIFGVAWLIRRSCLPEVENGN